MCWNVYVNNWFLNLFIFFIFIVVVYECIWIIISIYFDKGLIDKVVRCVGVFFVVKINDIKYIGKDYLILWIVLK